MLRVITQALPHSSHCMNLHRNCHEVGHCRGRYSLAHLPTGGKLLPLCVDVFCLLLFPSVTIQIDDKSFTAQCQSENYKKTYLFLLQFSPAGSSYLSVSSKENRQERKKERKTKRKRKKSRSFRQYSSVSPRWWRCQGR